MATPIAEGSVQKTLSAGDIPRVPETAHLPSTSSEGGPHDSTLERPSSNQSPVASFSIPNYPSPLPHVALLGDRHNHPTPPPLAQRAQLPNVQRERPDNATDTRRSSVYMKLLLHLGLGRNAPRARKALVSLVWTVSWYFAQIVVITTMLVLAGIHYRSPVNSSLSEWKACDRPLGTWASIWVVRVVLSLILTIWEYQRDRQIRLLREDVEGVELNGGPSVARTDARANPHNFAARSPNSRNGPLNPVEIPETPPLPHSALYSRLTLVSSLLTLSWFLTAHILEYSSINTCRHTSPHLWWLVFGILCIMYLMVLEVVLLGIIVLIIAPILFIFWNIFLMCLGRHPLQNPHMIKPEIAGLPKAVVDRIPLVMYIPPPPEGETNEEQGVLHVYPPKNAVESQPPQQKRFKLLRKFRPSQLAKAEKATIDEKSNGSTPQDDVDDNEPISWEDNWERNDYPFVALDGNRAVCAICLLDFEEPKRKHPHPLPAENQTKAEDNQNVVLPGQDNVASGTIITLPAQIPSAPDDSRRDPLKLEDAGEGPQPLRLLACGHVFHKTCLDPWLIDVSGRCPICQRPVEALKVQKKSRWRPLPQA